VFCGFWKLKCITAQTVIHWNQGVAANVNILQQMKIVARQNSNGSFVRENKTRLACAAQNVTSKYKKQRQLNRQKR